jgi:hypothetical protein
MITVDCKSMPTLKSPMAIFTADKIGVVPSLKINEFVLTPINDDEELDSTKIIGAIKDFLNSLAIEKHYAVIQKNDLISIVPLDDYKLENISGNLTDQFFSCIHCGFVTQFESIHNNHMKIHYL